MEINTIISRFLGGGSFEFFLQNKYNKQLVVNDKFVPLYNFWNQAKNNNQALCDILSTNLGTTKEQF